MMTDIPSERNQMMQELMGTARNLSLAMSDDGPRPMVEVILITSEPMFSIDGGGDMVRSRVPSAIRFLSPPDGLRKLSERLLEYADEAADIAESLNTALTHPERKPTSSSDRVDEAQREEDR